MANTILSSETNFDNFFGGNSALRAAVTNSNSLKSDFRREYREAKRRGDFTKARKVRQEALGAGFQLSGIEQAGDLERDLIRRDQQNQALQQLNERNLVLGNQVKQKQAALLQGLVENNKQFGLNPDNRRKLPAKKKTELPKPSIIPSGIPSPIQAEEQTEQINQGSPLDINQFSRVLPDSSNPPIITNRFKVDPVSNPNPFTPPEFQDLPELPVEAPDLIGDGAFRGKALFPTPVENTDGFDQVADALIAFSENEEKTALQQTVDNSFSSEDLLDFSNPNISEGGVFDNNILLDFPVVEQEQVNEVFEQAEPIETVVIGGQEKVLTSEGEQTDISLSDIPDYLKGFIDLLGQSETVDGRDNEKLSFVFDHMSEFLGQLKDKDGDGATFDDCPWCAGLVSTALNDAGKLDKVITNAQGFRKVGRKVSTPTQGDIVVFKDRGGNRLKGHVGFWLGENEDSVFVLDGNNGDAIGINKFPKSRVIETRRVN